MYPWNEPDSGVNHDQDQAAAARLPAPRTSAEPRSGARHPDDVPADFTRAIQFALDRRDNGGDAAPASQPATQLATQPAASLTPQ
jgi:hypothetical protein